VRHSRLQFAVALKGVTKDGFPRPAELCPHGGAVPNPSGMR
jgi:hypothetical protein